MSYERHRKPRHHVAFRAQGLVCLLLLTALCVHLYAHFRLSAANRNCSVSWPSAASRHIQPRIAVVSLSSARAASIKAGAASNARHEAFVGLAHITGENKAHYATLHGYTYYDASDVMDVSRPASWSKILAVQRHLHDFDWVMWMDADAVVTNMALPLEIVLPLEPGMDLILTSDATGANAGMWIMRNTPWSHAFLDTWWAMVPFIRRTPGDSKSGDNDALKYMMQHMSREDMTHIGCAPQCAFNSYVWRPSIRNWLRYLWDPTATVQGLYHEGDFVLHLAGIADKLPVLQRYLKLQDMQNKT